MTQGILVLNAGSSSLKFALYRAEDLACLCRGGIDGIGKNVRLTLSKAPPEIMAAPAEAPLNEGREGIDKRSGLLGVSGFSDDVRELCASNRSEAAEALELFVYRTSRELGSLIAALGGLDALVFTAGIGEHSAHLRERICALSAWAGIDIDATANANNSARISSERSAVGVYVVPTNEELIIARATCRLLQLPGGCVDR